MGERKRAIRFVNGGKLFPIRRNQNAQALIEFVLILPILLILVVGAIELGRLWSTKIILTNAAREGAYYLTTHPSDYDTGGNKTYLAAYNEALSSGVTLTTGDVTIADCCTIGEAVKVTVQTQVKNLLILGFLSNFTVEKTYEGDFPLSSTVEMMVQ
jgi:Flp pilus assembly protein TadG